MGFLVGFFVGIAVLLTVGEMVGDFEDFVGEGVGNLLGALPRVGEILTVGVRTGDDVGHGGQ